LYIVPFTMVWMGSANQRSADLVTCAEDPPHLLVTWLIGMRYWHVGESESLRAPPSPTRFQVFYSDTKRYHTAG